MPEEPTLTETELLRLFAVRAMIRKREEKLQSLTGVRTGSYFHFSGGKSSGNRSNPTEDTALKRAELKREIKEILFPEYKELTGKASLYIDSNYPTGQAGFLIDVFCFGIEPAHAKKVYCLRRSEADSLQAEFLQRIREGTDNAGNEEAGRSPADTDPDTGTAEANTRSRQAPAD